MKSNLQLHEGRKWLSDIRHGGITNEHREMLEVVDAVIIFLVILSSWLIL
jgi:hypothetical protein